jgi:hypothetical protein
MHSFAWRLAPLSVIGFVSLSASITSVSDVQLLFQRLKPWDAFSPAPVCSGFNIVRTAVQELQ